LSGGGRERNFKPEPTKRRAQEGAKKVKKHKRRKLRPTIVGKDTDEGNGQNTWLEKWDEKKMQRGEKKRSKPQDGRSERDTRLSKSSPALIAIAFETYS